MARRVTKIQIEIGDAESTCPMCSGSGHVPSMITRSLARHDRQTVQDVYLRLRLSGVPPTRAVEWLADRLGLEIRQVWRLVASD